MVRGRKGGVAVCPKTRHQMWDRKTKVRHPVVAPEQTPLITLTLLGRERPPKQAHQHALVLHGRKRAHASAGTGLGSRMGKD